MTLHLKKLFAKGSCDRHEVIIQEYDYSAPL